MAWIDTYKHLLPRAKAWTITTEKFLRKFFVGLTGLPEDVREAFDLIWSDLFAQTTRELDAWEKQFDIRNTTGLTEQERRDRLAAAWKVLGGQSPSYIQGVLQDHGFDVYVHEWWVPGGSTARDPNAVVEWAAWYGGTPLTKGYPLVNKLVTGDRGWTALAGDTDVECGDPVAICGDYSGLVFRPVPSYPSEDTATWPFWAYIGASLFGNLALVPVNRRDEFEDLVLKICPLQLWIGALVQYFDGYSYILDGRMERPDVDEWASVGATVFSKDSGTVYNGALSLTVDSGFGGDGFATSVPIPADTSIEYLLTGASRSKTGIRGTIQPAGGSRFWLAPGYAPVINTWMRFNLIWPVHSGNGWDAPQFVSVGNPIPTQNWWMDDIKFLPVLSFIDGGLCDSAPDISNWGATGGAAVVFQSGSAERHSGEGCMKITGGGTIGDGAEQTMTSTPEGAAFFLRLWIRNETAAELAGVYQDAVLKWTSNSLPDVWTYYEIELRTADGLDLKIGHTNTSTGVIFVDEVVVFTPAVLPGPPAPVLTDGDMEADGLGSWDALGGVTITKDTSTVYLGSQSLKLVSGTPVSVNGTRQVIEVPEDAGVRYLFEFRAWYVSGMRPHIRRDGAVLWTADNNNFSQWNKANFIYDPHGGGDGRNFEVTFIIPIPGFEMYLDDMWLTPVKQLDTDGQMDVPGTTEYAATGGATITKTATVALVKSGTRSLKITGGGTIEDGAEQTLTAPDGDIYHVKGWLMNGTASEQGGVYQDGVLRWMSPATEGVYEYFNLILRVTDGLDLKFAHTNTSTGDIFVDEVVAYEKVEPERDREPVLV